ncbi:FAD-dependent monooxygenase [Streptomyces sp. RB6PN25]|uniref:FAD-dependent monooxygenase n=1 Tax=Streptomyces humicola TaxID=2953240 RepID=A0ABT1Q2Z4_9ACTN|nr:FAD-dependent monooxygenase [Streptomyces humicola]MCQ4084303.1 FAD-dependent monooxygenase [Streptomyces humicola]
MSDSPDSLHTPVAVVGGDPAGLMLALFLDHHGVPSVVFDVCDPDGAPRNPPCATTQNARTMEHYRRLGVSASIRRLGLPCEHPTDIAFFTRYNGHELSRLPLPGTTQRLRRVAAAPRTDQLPEPAHRVDDTRARAFLHDHVRTRPNITVMSGRTVTGVEQDADRVRVRAERPGHAREEWTARYAVVSDAGRDLVHHTLGIRYERPGPLDRNSRGYGVTTAHLRLPGFHRDVLAGAPAWSHWVLNAELVAQLVALGGADEFLFRVAGPADAGPLGEGRLTDVVRRAAGTALPVEILGPCSWTPAAAYVAERFIRGRIFLMGDSAHPAGLYGDFMMNAGVDDAANLAWKLAAVLQGWGGPQLLASYEAERRPAAVRALAAARELDAELNAITRPAALEACTAEGEAVRDRTGALLRGFGEHTHAVGIQLGTRYDDSPVVASQAQPPGDSWGTYVPTSVAGGRAPHLWLDDWHGRGSSLFDRFGPCCSLLRLGPEPPSGKPLQAAAQASGMPLTVLDVDGDAARDLYERDLVLIRPDQHVAWRGNRWPTDPGDLVALVTGAGQQWPGRRV